MTAVRHAPRTGEIQIEITGSGTPKTDEIIKDLAGVVWELICAGEIRGALVLIRARAEEYEQAWREEYASVPAPPTPQAIEPTRNCTSMLHALLSCPQALAEGVLPEGEPFCGPCSEQQLALPETPAVEEAPGRIVAVVTSAPDTKPIRRRRAS